MSARDRQRGLRYRRAFAFAGDGEASPFGNTPVFGGTPAWGWPLLINEGWTAYGTVVIEDSAPANALWEAGEIATCGPAAVDAGGYVRNGIVSSGTASWLRRQVTPNIDYARYHSIETEFIQVNADGCLGSIGLEAAATITQGQIFLQVRQAGGNKELRVSAPGVASTVVETFASAVGGQATNLKLEVYPLAGATRRVRVYRDGVHKGTYLATAGTTTNRNVALYFDNFGVNAGDRVRIGRVRVRGYV